MTVLPPTDEGIAIAAAAVRAGDIVAYPTETVYGLAVDPFNEAALARLFTAKGRDETQAILLIVSDPDALDRVAAEVSPAARRYMQAFWPGPLSLLLPKAPELPERVTAGRDKVCVRCPDCVPARALCRAVNGPVTSTSANRSGQPPVMSPEDLDLPGVAYALDGGRLPPSAPSTILDPDTGEILRAGAIPEARLRSLRV